MKQPSAIHPRTRAERNPSRNYRMKTPFLPVLTALALAALPAGAASTVIDNSSPSGFSIFQA